jgi:hypothetical protein
MFWSINESVSLILLLLLKHVWDCNSGGIIIVTVQSIFYLEIYQNKFFLFLQIIFDSNTSKESKNIKKISF